MIIQSQPDYPAYTTAPLEMTDNAKTAMIRCEWRLK